MRVFAKYILIVALISILGCKEKFTPKLNEVSDRLLVVEGIIALGSASTQIDLSRTVPISEVGNRIPERGAQVSIEGNDNFRASLFETIPGRYESGNINLNPERRYRLKIVTKGSEYVTDFLEAKVTPAIEDVTWEEKPNGIQIYVSTRDNTNKSRYYRWSFDETWVFYANYNSSLVWEPSGLRSRRRDIEDIYQCWGNAASNSIVLASSIKLADDVIYKQPVTLIPSSSEKLSAKYSILVKQTVLTKEAFEFWENLRRNTENLGTIFDALPSQLTGNIRSIRNPSEPVLGYISVGNVTTKRIFVTRGEFSNWRVQPSVTCAPPDTIVNNRVNAIFSNPAYVPLEEAFNDVGFSIGFTGTTRICGDCTLRGTNRRPTFWQ